MSGNRKKSYAEQYDKIEELDFHRYVAALRGREDNQAPWLEAPNRYVAGWVKENRAMIEEFIRPRASLEVRVCVGRTKVTAEISVRGNRHSKTI